MLEGVKRDIRNQEVERIGWGVNEVLIELFCVQAFQCAYCISPDLGNRLRRVQASRHQRERHKRDKKKLQAVRSTTVAV